MPRNWDRNTCNCIPDCNALGVCNGDGWHYDYINEECVCCETENGGWTGVECIECADDEEWNPDLRQCVKKPVFDGDICVEIVGFHDRCHWGIWWWHGWWGWGYQGIPIVISRPSGGNFDGISEITLKLGNTAPITIPVAENAWAGAPANWTGEGWAYKCDRTQWSHSWALAQKGDDQSTWTHWCSSPPGQVIVAFLPPAVMWGAWMFNATPGKEIVEIRDWQNNVVIQGGWNDPMQWHWSHWNPLGGPGGLWWGFWWGNQCMWHDWRWWHPWYWTHWHHESHRLFVVYREIDNAGNPILVNGEEVRTIEPVWHFEWWQHAVNPSAPIRIEVGDSAAIFVSNYWWGCHRYCGNCWWWYGKIVWGNWDCWWWQSTVDAGFASGLPEPEEGTQWIMANRIPITIWKRSWGYDWPCFEHVEYNSPSISIFGGGFVVFNAGTGNQSGHNTNWELQIPEGGNVLDTVVSVTTPNFAGGNIVNETDSFNIGDVVEWANTIPGNHDGCWTIWITVYTLIELGDECPCVDGWQNLVPPNQWEHINSHKITASGLVNVPVRRAHACDTHWRIYRCGMAFAGIADHCVPRTRLVASGTYGTTGQWPVGSTRSISVSNINNFVDLHGRAVRGGCFDVVASGRNRQTRYQINARMWEDAHQCPGAFGTITLRVNGVNVGSASFDTGTTDYGGTMPINVAADVAFINAVTDEIKLGDPLVVEVVVNATARWSTSTQFPGWPTGGSHDAGRVFVTVTRLADGARWGGANQLFTNLSDRCSHNNGPCPINYTESRTIQCQQFN